MDKRIIILLSLIALLGLFLLGSSITGLVFSETCCFPPDCNPENMCDAITEQPLNTNTGYQRWSYAGLLIIMFSVISYITIHQKKHLI